MNLQEAADLLGVHYQTAYRWVRQGQLRALKVGASYEIDQAEVERYLAERAAPVPPPERAHVRSWEAQSERLLAALLEGDEQLAHQLVDRLHQNGIPVAELCGNLIVPVMRTIGDRWHRGELGIADEHRATAIIERILGLLAAQPRGRPRGTVVVTSAPGDLHTLPSTMAAMALRNDRWRVHHLGGSVPMPEVADLAVRVAADVVVLSMTVGVGDEEATEVDALRSQLRAHGIGLLVGGPGATLQDLLLAARTATRHGTDEETDRPVDPAEENRPASATAS